MLNSTLRSDIGADGCVKQATAQAEVVLLVQIRCCHYCLGRYSHRNDAQGWWDRRYLEPGVHGPWLPKVLANPLEHDECYRRLGNHGYERAGFHSLPEEAARRILAGSVPALDLTSPGIVRNHQYIFGQSRLWLIHMGSSRLGCSMGWSRGPLRSLLRRLCVVCRADRNQPLCERHQRF